MTNSTAEISTIQMEIDIDASTDKVWQALVSNIGEWWPAEFYTGGDADSRRFTIEATPGGRMFEEWGDGGGTLWGTVIALDPGKKLQIIGYLFPDWGGPTQNYGTWTLDENGGKTRMTFSETGLGRVTEEGLKEKDHGWRFVWETLKAHVEGKPKPVWAD
tara:strand:- start:20395 stop:20874 length:480 start_codon:yes stop_codon:yes gene_type:complete